MFKLLEKKGNHDYRKDLEAACDFINKCTQFKVYYKCAGKKEMIIKAEAK